jgi:hypothetical protein
MPRLGIGSSISKSSIVTLGIITDNLVLKHNYAGGEVVPVSDGAAYFDGSNDYIALSGTFSNNVHSISMWINPLGESGSMSLFDYRDANNDGIHIYLGDGDVVYQVDNADGHYDTKLALNQWHHVACTNDGSTSTIYVNGVSVETADTSGETINVSGSAEARLGTRSHTSTSNWFEGYMCNVGFWSGTLTQAQIKSIMNKNYAGLSTSEKTNLVSWWNLDSVPASGNAAHNSSLVGALQYEDGASDIGYGAHASVVGFSPTNDIELGADIFGGEGSFTTDTGYWTLSNDTKIENGLVITDTSSYNAIIKNGILTDGKIYKLSFDVIDFIDEGSLKFRFNWAQSSTGDAYPSIWKAADGKGSFHCYFEPGGSTVANFILYASDTTDNYGEIKIDNLVCQEVTNAGVLK